MSFGPFSFLVGEEMGDMDPMDVMDTVATDDL